MTWLIGMKFGMMMQLDLRTLSAVKILNCENPRWRTTAIFKTVKSLFLSNSSTDRREIW